MRSRLLNLSAPATRLLWFVTGLVLMLAALELFERRNAALFAASSHRALAKVAMFEKHPRVNFLFLGTSRTQDGVSPDLITRGLKTIAPGLGDVPGYNAAFTGSSLGALMDLAPRFGFRPDLRVVVIELSDAQIFNAPPSWEEPANPGLTLEDKLDAYAGQVYFIRYRRVWQKDNLGRLPALLFFSSSLSGWETRGTDQLASWAGHKEPTATGFDPALWQPEIFSSNAPAQTLNATNELVAQQLTALVARFHEHGIQVIFADPPLLTAYADAPERNGLRGLFAEVARRSRCEVWNFAPLQLPDGWFRDTSHLNRTGRAQYSQALAIQLSRVFGDK